MNNRLCKGMWMPIELWESKIPWSEKILFTEIDSRTTENEGIAMSVEDIAEFLCVSKTAAKDAIRHLISIGKVIRTKGKDGVEYYQSNNMMNVTVVETIDADKKAERETKAQERFEEREQAFLNECLSYSSEYGTEMVKRFYTYWSEPNKSHTRMRFEKEPTWEISRRLKTWASRDSYTKPQSVSSVSNGRTVDEIFGL